MNAASSPASRCRVSITTARCCSAACWSKLALTTTTIGAWPKPAYVTIPDWFQARTPAQCERITKEYTALAASDDWRDMIARGVREALREQTDAGIDIPTDGEIARDNYLHYHCRHLDGIDFARLTERSFRDDSYTLAMPTWVGPVGVREHFLPTDWALAQSLSEQPVKMTVPGPMSLAESTSDVHYGDARLLGAALAEALNYEIRALADAGCRHVQVDEPLFARFPKRALDYGIEHVERCFHGVPSGVQRIMHMCCGYPYGMDQVDYPKAPPESYFRLAGALDEAPIDAVSIEDAHRPNDLSLLELFADTTVLLGVVAIASSRIEHTDAIRDRLAGALEHIDAGRLVVAPDCGLGYLPRDLAVLKLRHMCSAARSL